MILAEIEVFRWVDDRAKSLLQVLIRYLTVSIDIKSCENLFKLSLRHRIAPMVAEILEFPRLNTARLAQIKLFKGALQRFPLLFELFDYLT